MNYSGETATLGLTLAATGAMFPFFSSFLGWLGVFVTGSDTSANALFGNLQVVTARSLGLNPRSWRRQFGRRRDGQDDQPAEHRGSGRRHGDAKDQEGRLFRFTLRHSIFLAALVGVIVMFYQYVLPQSRRR